MIVDGYYLEAFNHVYRTDYYDTKMENMCECNLCFRKNFRPDDLYTPSSKVTCFNDIIRNATENSKTRISILCLPTTDLNLCSFTIMVSKCLKCFCGYLVANVTKYMYLFEIRIHNVRWNKCISVPLDFC